MFTFDVNLICSKLQSDVNCSRDTSSVSCHYCWTVVVSIVRSRGLQKCSRLEFDLAAVVVSVSCCGNNYTISWIEYRVGVM